MESKLFVSFYLMYNRSIDVALLAKYGKCFKLMHFSTGTHLLCSKPMLLLYVHNVYWQCFAEINKDFLKKGLV